MRHLRKGRKLNRTASHRKALLRKLATDLFEHKRIITTEAKAKELRPYAERIITKAKNALVKEKEGLLPDGQTIDIHNRRVVARNIRNKEVLQELFDVIAPLVDERAGGYCRIIKLDYRRGDNAPKALIELVDWSAPQEGATSIKPKKKSKSKKETPEVKDDADEQIIEDFEDNIEEPKEETAEADTNDAQEPKEESAEAATDETTEQDEESRKEENQDDSSDDTNDDSEEDGDKSSDDKKKNE